MRSVFLALAVLLLALAGFWWFSAARSVRPPAPAPVPVVAGALADSVVAPVPADTRPAPPRAPRAAAPRRPVAAVRPAGRKPTPSPPVEADDPALVEWRRQQIRTGNAEQALPCDAAEYWDEDKGVWKYISYRFKQIHYVASRVMPRAPGVIEGRRGDSGPRNAY